MDDVENGKKAGVTPLSATKRHLLERYIASEPRKNAWPGAPLTSQSLYQQEVPRVKGQLFPRMRQLSLSDYPKVASLESKYGLGLKSYEQWSHIWLNNPVYHELGGNWPLGWVLEVQENQIVGSHENIPLLYEMNGNRIIAAQGRGLVLDSHYRGYSLLLLGAFFEQRNVELCFDTSASFEAAQSDTELGALRAPVGSWDRDAFWITNYTAFVTRWLKRRIPPKISAVAGPLSYPLGAGLFVKDKLRRTPQRCRNALSVAHCSSFDERFDDFWQQLREESPHVLLAVRTRKILKWHFAYALRQNRLWIWTVTQGARLVAYSIFLKVENSDSSITRVALVDFQALGGEATLLHPMLSAALQRCRLEKMHVLENPGLAFENSGITELAPYQRKRPWWTYFYKARDKELAEKLTSASAWNPSLYDGDASIL